MGKNLTKYVAENTAIVSFITPVFAGLETILIGMDNNDSIRARVIGIAAVYLGIGTLYSRGRDKFREKFNVNSGDSESKIQFYDTLYGFVFNLAVAPTFYYLAGCRDLKEILMGSATGITIGVTTAAAIGYAIETYKDLIGVETSKRLPNFISKLNAREKVFLATLLTTGSLAATCEIYMHH